MLVKSKDELLEEYKNKELFFIEKIVNGSKTTNNLDEIYKYVKDLAKCRDTINSLSDIYGYHQAELTMDTNEKTLVFVSNKS